MPERRRFGVALGGGGARGFAHLGVLIALERHGIAIDAIAGTSMGAAVGAAKALGMDLPKLARLLGCLDLNTLLRVSGSTLREVQRAIGRGMVEYMRGTDWREAPTAPEKLARMFELFSLLTARKSFSETVIPCAVVAADLETGEEIVLREGKLYQAVTASAAIPGVFYPVRHQGRFLIDGGLVNKVPADVVVEMGAEVVLAVDTGAPLGKPVDTSLDALFQAQKISSRTLTHLQLERVRERLGGRFLLLQPRVDGIGMLGFDRLPEAVQAGEEEAESHLKEILALAGRSALSSPPPATVFP